jgi:hypothetical protein
MISQRYRARNPATTTMAFTWPDDIFGKRPTVTAGAC